MTELAVSNESPVGVLADVVHDFDADIAHQSSPASPSIPIRRSKKKIPRRLFDCLSSDWISPRKTYFETIQNPINPGLHILNAGIIGLPLSDSAAKMICDVSADLEPKDEATEEKVRTAFTISPAVLKLGNPAFIAWLRELSIKVNLDLRTTGRTKSAGIQAHFSGLMLQPPCASNEPLRLAPQMKNTYAMMVVVLPTSHTGGDILFSSGGETMTYGTSMASPFGCTVATWLIDKDFKVELGPIESGYRVMLVYDLFFDEKVHFPSAALTLSKEETLRNTLLDFKEFPAATGQIAGVLAYILNNTRNISGEVLDALDVEDRDLVEALRKLCKKTGLLFYLANVEVQFSGQVVTNFTPESVLLTEVSDLDNTKMAYFVNIEGENLVADMLLQFGDWKLGKNEDGEDIHTYYGVAALLVVPSCYPPLLLNPENLGEFDVYRWLDNVIKTTTTHPDDMATEQLRYACRYITTKYVEYEHGISKYAKQPFQRKVIDLVIKASAITGELDLSFNLENLTIESRSEIGAFIAKHGFPAVEKSLSVSISKLRHITSRRLVLNELETAVFAACETENSVTKNLMNVWREKQAVNTLRDCIYETSEDANCLALMTGKYGSHFLVTNIIETVRKHAERTCFVLYFLNHLAREGPLMNLPGDAVRSSYRTLIPEILPRLKLRSQQNDTSRRAASHSSTAKTTQEPIWENVAELLRNCVEYRVDDGLANLVRHFLKEAKSRKNDYDADFENVYLPFLTHLYELMKELQITRAKSWEYRGNEQKFLENAHIRRLFRKLVKTQLMKLHSPDPPLPAHPTNWVKPKKGCSELSCRDCRKLDRFLQDATKKQHQFKGHTQRRKHIEEQFGELVVTHNSQGYTAKSLTEKEFRLKVLTEPYPGLLIIEKSHQDFEDRIELWSKKCWHSLNLIHDNLIKNGAADMLGECVALMADVKEMVDLKLKISEAHLELCNQESSVANH